MAQLEFPEEGLWLIGSLSEKLMARNMVLGTAESCTGGLASALCTNIPGSSRWFSGSVVAYANHVKTGLLHVDAALLERFGAVSAPVAEAMAVGALPALGADVSLAITGIAGPEGGTHEKPVGTVWFATALAARDGSGTPPKVNSFSRHFPGDRHDVRFGAALAAFAAVEVLLKTL